MKRHLLFKWLTSLLIPSKENSFPFTKCNHDLFLPHKISFILAVSQVKQIPEEAGQLKKNHTKSKSAHMRSGQLKQWSRWS